MTGFAFGETNVGALRLTAELKSYNNRFLDLIVSLPPALAPWEPSLRELLSERLARGRVEVTFRFRDASEGTAVSVDQALARNVADALEQLKRATGTSGRIRLEQVAAFPGVLTVSRDLDVEALRNAAKQLLDRLLGEFESARVTEGERLQADILRQLDTLTEGRMFVAGQSSAMEQTFRENLARKFRELAAEVDENRVHAETALLLVRYGINEELVRLESHEQTFRSLLQEKGAVGKKLDFLCQELGREINTIGSKTTFAGVQQTVVKMKDALENIREQLRNVE